jgi:hypothetical protein
MKLFYSLLILITLPILLNAQQLSSITTLDNALKETSGLIFLDNRLITHNDSGREPALYEIDSTSGKITRKVVVSNASNVDWEDICHDGTYIYIGDIGNNQGTRTDLKIYRLLISDYLNTTNDTVTVDVISYSYANQTDFTPSEFETNFDAEALIAFNDSLYIFTKNWGNLQSNIYAIPKKPGTYKPSTSGKIDSQGLITGATYNQLSKKVLLSGYTTNPLSAFLIEISQTTKNELLNGTVRRFEIQPQGTYQIESIATLNFNQYYLTAEESMTGKATLYRFESENVLGIKPVLDLNTLLYPNPASGYLHVQCDNLLEAEFYTSQGVLKKIAKANPIDITDLGKGVYFVVLKKRGEEKPEIKRLVIQ